jgi:hypothetical protein
MMLKEMLISQRFIFHFDEMDISERRQNHWYYCSFLNKPGQELIAKQSQQCESHLHAQ